MASKFLQPVKASRYSASCRLPNGHVPSLRCARPLRLGTVLMTERPHVFIATPCYGGLVTQGYMQSVIALMTQAAPNGVELSLGLLGHDALITRSRNTLL